MERKRIKVVMLPTERKEAEMMSSMVMKYKSKLYQYHDSRYEYDKAQPHHLYFTTDEEIKEGDWYVAKVFGVLMVQKCEDKEHEADCKIPKYEAIKIIASTDPNICWEKGFVGIISSALLPQPSSAFIKKYCELGGIDEVDVEYIIPSYDDWMDNGRQPLARVPKVDSHNTITIHSIKDSWDREEHILGMRRAALWAMELKEVPTKEEMNQWIEENL